MTVQSKIDALVGLPYVQDGRDPRPVSDGGDGGVDCWGLLWLAEKAMGVEIPSRQPSSAASMREFFVPLCEGAGLRVGDVLVIDPPDGELHVGMVLDAFRFVHATSACGSVRDRIEHWRPGGLIRARLRPIVLMGEGRR